MALYTIGEVALLCDINPVTLRAWQRRYGLLKPQRTDGGHRLFNDADIDRIREIKRWIDNGVQVSKVKMLLSNENVDVQNGWRDQQETLLTYLQSGNLHSLRTWIKECIDSLEVRKKTGRTLDYSGSDGIRFGGACKPVAQILVVNQ